MKKTEKKEQIDDVMYKSLCRKVKVTFNDGDEVIVYPSIFLSREDSSDGLAWIDMDVDEKHCCGFLENEIKSIEILD